MSDRDTTGTIFDIVDAEDGHAYAWGGGGLLTIVLIVLLLVWIL